MSSELSQEEVQAKGFLTSVSGTHVGMRREENQDSHLIFETDRFQCLIVADGMGGAQGGAVASSMALEIFQEKLVQAEEINEEIISEAIREANRQVYTAGTSDPTLLGMGTTFVGLCFVDHSLYLFNVGDSRVYRIRNGQIKALTEDHTLIMDLIRSGAISPDQADNHPVSHMLTRSLGPAEDVLPDCWLCEDGPAKGDRYIICSDGLYNMVSEVVMQRIAKDNTLDVARDECIRLANENGGTDNITVIVVEVGEEFPVGPEEYSLIPDVDTEEDTIEFRINPDEVYDGDGKGPEPFQNGNSSNQVNSAGEDTGDTEESRSPEISGSISLEVKRTFGLDEDEDSQQEEATESEELPTDLDQVEAVVEDVEEAELSGEQSHLTDAPELDGSEESGADPDGEQAFFDEQEALESAPSGRSRPITLLLVFCFGVAATLCSGILYQYFVKVQEPEVVTVRRNSVKKSPGALAGKREPNQKNFRKKGNAGGKKLQRENATRVANQNNKNAAANRNKQTPTGDRGKKPAEKNTAPSEVEGGLSPDRTKEVRRRRRYIRERIKTLQQRLATFDQPLSGGVGERLVVVRRKLDNTRAEQAKLKSKIEEASQGVSLWYGRQRRLQNTDHVSLASEISDTSPEVKSAKDKFENATWEYLKKAESLRYDAENEELKAEVEQLTRARKDSLKQLRKVVGQAINQESDRANKTLNEYTTKRDLAQQSIMDLEEDLRYLKALTGQDKKAQKQLRLEFTSQLEVARSELSELDQILPPTPPKSAEVAADGKS